MGGSEVLVTFESREGRLSSGLDKGVAEESEEDCVAERTVSAEEGGRDWCCGMQGLLVGVLARPGPRAFGAG